MTVRSIKSNNGTDLTISIKGHFNSKIQQDFRNTFENEENIHDSYTVDLSETSSLDSSAIGVLLMLRDHAGGKSADINIVNCNPDVRKSLDFYQFEKIFTIT